MATENKTKIVIALIGPKGAGKTHTGQALENECGIKFLNVEKMGLENIPKSQLSGNDLIIEGFQLEEVAIDRILSLENAVSFENTGAHEYFYVALERLRSKYKVLLVNVSTPLETCYDRIKKRDTKAHIAVSDELLKSINEKAARVSLNWDLVIDNSKLVSNSDLKKMFSKLFGNK